MLAATGSKPAGDDYVNVLRCQLGKQRMQELGRVGAIRVHHAQHCIVMPRCFSQECTDPRVHRDAEASVALMANDLYKQSVVPVISDRRSMVAAAVIHNND